MCKIRFLSSLHAEECLNLMHGRYFDTRQLECFYWDGKTDYKVVRESKDTVNQRISEFGDWLEGQDLPEEFQVRTEEDAMAGGSGAGKLKEKREEKQMGK